LSFAALLWQKPRSVTGLEQLLQGYFALPIRIQQFIGKWQRGDAELQTKIGVQEGKYHHLGQEAVLGHKSWDQGDGIMVVIGPGQR
jgi:type VI secretion system protein ImpH